MSLIFAMCLFSLSMSISPGPVNMIALSTGVNYGFRRAVPFVSGATIGFSILLFAVGLGINGLGSGLENASSYTSQFFQLLKYAGALFIAYTGFKIITSNSEIKTQNTDLSSSFFHGFILQWLNPKAWIACISGVTAFNLQALNELTLFVSLYFIICYISVGSWALAGSRIAPVLSDTRKLRIFNILTGGILVIVALYLMFL